MHLFGKVSAVISGAVMFASLIVLIAYLFGLTIIDLLLMVILSLYIIGVEFDILADLSEAKSPFKSRLGKMLLALDLTITVLLLFGGLFYPFFGDIALGTPLTAGGIIATILAARILRLNKLPSKKANLKHERK